MKIVPLTVSFQAADTTIEGIIRNFPNLGRYDFITANDPLPIPGLSLEGSNMLEKISEKIIY
jgi:hypothetical protein